MSASPGPSPMPRSRADAAAPMCPSWSTSATRSAPDRVVVSSFLVDASIVSTPTSTTRDAPEVRARTERT